MEDPLDIWFEPQRLRQQGEMDCGVSVFAELANMSREEILNDIPEAMNGISVERWKAYFTGKGFEVREYIPDDEYPSPCAHLVASGGGYHRVYQATNGGIHDPSPVFESTPPRTIKLKTHYAATLVTIALEPKAR
jgi:hypothetical protein